MKKAEEKRKLLADREIKNVESSGRKIMAKARPVKRGTGLRRVKSHDENADLLEFLNEDA